MVMKEVDEEQENRDRKREKATGMSGDDRSFLCGVCSGFPSVNCRRGYWTSSSGVEESALWGRLVLEDQLDCQCLLLMLARHGSR